MFTASVERDAQAKKASQLHSVPKTSETCSTMSFGSPKNLSPSLAAKAKKSALLKCPQDVARAKAVAGAAVVVDDAAAEAAAEAKGVHAEALAHETLPDVRKDDAAASQVVRKVRDDRAAARAQALHLRVTTSPRLLAGAAKQPRAVESLEEPSKARAHIRPGEAHRRRAFDAQIKQITR